MPPEISASQKRDFPVDIGSTNEAIEVYGWREILIIQLKLTSLHGVSMAARIGVLVESPSDECLER